MAWAAPQGRSCCYSTVILSNTHARSRSTRAAMSQHQHLRLMTVFTDPPARQPAPAGSDARLLFCSVMNQKAPTGRRISVLEMTRTSQRCMVSSDWIASWLLSKMFFNSLTFVPWSARYPQQLIDIRISQYWKMYSEWVISISASWKIRSGRETIHGEWLQLC